ncbi:MAG: LysR substrate-binding domain-containing protein [Arenibacterium sp.]
MDLLLAMRVVREVSRQGNFSAAAAPLKLSPASVGRIVAELEADLGVPLFTRTTRRMSLTQAGREFVDRSHGILEEVAHLKTRTQETHNKIRGTLRVSAVQAFGTACIAPAIAEFLLKHPDIEVALDITNRFVDLIEEPYDLAIRAGKQPDSSLIARRIFTQRIIPVAAPSYLAERGTPRTLADLNGHRAISQVSGRWGQEITLWKDGKAQRLKIPQQFVLTTPEAARRALLSGYGYGVVSDCYVVDDISAGRLVRLLPDYEPDPQPIFAVYADRRYVPAALRALLDFLIDTLPKSGFAE